MKQIIFSANNKEEIYFDDINRYKPIFVREDGSLIGMVVLESQGWIIRLGERFTATGHHDTLKKCLISGHPRYTYHIECDEEGEG